MTHYRKSPYATSNSVYKLLAHNVHSITSLGNCCKAGVPILQASSSESQLILIDFSPHKKRKGNLAKGSATIRDAVSYEHIEGVTQALLQGSVLSIEIPAGKVGIIKGVAIATCDDPLRTRLVQHFLLKLPK